MGKTIRPYTHTCRIQFLIYILLLLLIYGNAVSQEAVAVPENPRIPDVVIPGIDEVKDISVLKVKMRFNIYGSGEKIYTMIIPDEMSEFEVNSKDYGGIKKISFKDMAGLEIKEWAGVPDKSGAFVFYPERYILTLKNDEKITVGENIPFFNTINIEADGNSRVLYTLFYDYYKKDMWFNRGVKSPDTTSTLPLKGCVTGIRVN
jgi:hypothetical protein